MASKGFYDFVASNFTEYNQLFVDENPVFYYNPILSSVCCYGPCSKCYLAPKYEYSMLSKCKEDHSWSTEGLYQHYPELAI